MAETLVLVNILERDLGFSEKSLTSDLEMESKVYTHPHPPNP